MKRNLLKPVSLIVCLLVLLGCRAEGNNPVTDSLNFANAKWQRSYAEGITFLEHQFQKDPLFGAAQHLFLMEIPASEVHRIHFAYDTFLTETSIQASRLGALAAVNGSFFDMVLGNPICYLRIDGKEVGENTPMKPGDANRKYYQYATLCLAGDSLVMVIPESNRFAERQLPYRNVMTAGPMLIYHDSIIPQRNDRTFVTNRHNRTALGLRTDGTVIILVADGRFKGTAEGFTLPELATVMRWLGCRDAINFDGGGSTTLYRRPADKKNSGVVNFPTDNGRHDHEGERPVSSIVYIK